jgi:hypothetical protein
MNQKLSEMRKQKRESVLEKPRVVQTKSKVEPKMIPRNLTLNDTYYKVVEPE